MNRPSYLHLPLEEQRQIARSLTCSEHGATGEIAISVGKNGNCSARIVGCCDAFVIAISDHLIGDVQPELQHTARS
jgi:hypothetical protein